MASTGGELGHAGLKLPIHVQGCGEMLQNAQREDADKEIKGVSAHGTAVMVGSGLGRACAREEATEARKQGVLGAAPGALALCERLGHPGPSVGRAPSLGPMEDAGRTLLPSAPRMPLTPG